jgi:Putative prokaryotic signal transducing protein
MTDDELVVLSTFPNRIEAEMAQGALENADIDAMVSGDDAGGVEPGLWTQGIRLLVRQGDVERARDVLDGTSRVPES